VVVYTENHLTRFDVEVERSGDFQGADEDVARRGEETGCDPTGCCAAATGEGANRRRPAPRHPQGQAPTGIWRGSEGTSSSGENIV